MHKKVQKFHRDAADEKVYGGMAAGASKEPLNKSSAERVADKIGMITRRTTQVVAWSTMPRSATQWRPKSVARGAPLSGDRAVVGAETARLYVAWALASRYGVASSFGRHCSALRGRARFCSNPKGQGFTGGLLCQAPSEGD